MTDAVLYYRVSTVEQDLEPQERYCHDYCERMGYTIVGEYQDKVSGRNLNRPQFKEMMGYLRTHHKDTVLVAYKLDRLSRSVIDFSQLCATLKSYKVSIETSQGDFDLTSPTSEFVVNLLGSVAQLERSLISERTKTALANKKARGVILGRRSYVPPYEKIVELHNEGMSYKAIAFKYGVTYQAIWQARKNHKLKGGV